jgi:chemotaxis protein methyltransferase CheR
MSNMPASIITSEMERIEPDPFVQALKRRHGRDFSQYAPASLRRRDNRPAPLKPDGTVPPLTPAMAANGQGRPGRTVPLPT